MTSGQFTRLPLSSITVDRASRQRREISEDDIASLADSIARKGLINPITVTRQGELVAGETRFLATQRLGHIDIAVQFVDDLTPSELKEIELEENIKRKDLSWQDKSRALYELHELYSESRPDWSTAETAKAIGYSERSVREQLQVAKELVSGNAAVAAAPQYSTAKGITVRKAERARVDEAVLLDSTLPEAKPEANVIHEADFNEWVKTYEGPPFNFVHCDFPYGVGADKFNQGAAKSFGGYSDTPDEYWRLVASLVNNRQLILGESAHIIFWFSPEHYSKTFEALSSVFRVQKYPLIWNKINAGIIPDPQRSPRQIYEMAFMCSHGDRKIVKSVANLVSAPISREGSHMSEKAQPMLEHFFQMFVDENTRFLDPSCGSGSSLRAARSLGAKFLTGLEINPGFAENARLAFRKE